MFGLFNKPNPMRHANAEIDAIALMAIEESYIFAAKVLGNLPKDYDDNQLLSCLEAQRAKSESKQTTHGEYINGCKIGFEFSCFMLEYASRYFRSAEGNVGDYVYQRMSEKILDKYTDSYKSFMENNPKEIYNTLANMVDKRAEDYVHLKMNPREDDRIGDTVGDEVAGKVCQIANNAESRGINEFWRVIRHLYCSAFDKKFAEGFLDIKNKLEN